MVEVVALAVKVAVHLAVGTADPEARKAVAAVSRYPLKLS